VLGGAATGPADTPVACESSTATTASYFRARATIRQVAMSPSIEKMPSVNTRRSRRSLRLQLRFEVGHVGVLVDRRLNL